MLKRLLKLPSPFTICLILAWSVGVRAQDEQSVQEPKVQDDDSVVVFEEVQQTEDVNENDNLPQDIKASLDDEEAYREKNRSGS
jgi:hypothetical protein